jgi:hypothetical protein
MIRHGYAQAHISMRSKLALSSADLGVGSLSADNMSRADRRSARIPYDGHEVVKPNLTGSARFRLVMVFT